MQMGIALGLGIGTTPAAAAEEGGGEELTFLRFGDFVEETYEVASAPATVDDIVFADDDYADFDTSDPAYFVGGVGCISGAPSVVGAAAFSAGKMLVFEVDVLDITNARVDTELYDLGNYNIDVTGSFVPGTETYAGCHQGNFGGSRLGFVPEKLLTIGRNRVALMWTADEVGMGVNGEAVTGATGGGFPAAWVATPPDTFTFPFFTDAKIVITFIGIVDSKTMADLAAVSAL